ncbi:MAG: hypothetical protein JJU36_00425 [Phycisphaeraceae bacterium]|nr:hypothetical protein [Phycisphaeraceae bacterium]
MPAHLDSVPIDPFTGDPLKLVHFDGGCLVYFVDDQTLDEGGIDLRDDGTVGKKDRHHGVLIFRR